MSAPAGVAGIPATERRLPGIIKLLRAMFRRTDGKISLILVGALVLILVFAPLIAPYDAAHQDIEHRLEGPSQAHILGTDHLGRDLFSRLVYGTRVALGTAFPSVSAAMLVGVLLGMTAGYLGGRVDNIILIVMDTLQAFPAVILTLALLALLGPSTTNVIIVIAIAYTPGYARIVRAQVLSFKENPFIEVERSLGAGDLRIIFIHLLPNILAPLVILLAMDLPTAITTEAGLSFLGLGVRPPTPSWGIILADGFAKIRSSPWPVLWASLTLMITTLGFTLFGETLRDVLDPKLAGTRRA
jgi:peptide/nickel transport system permease protein